MNPKYPIYVISKGRWESRLTSKALEAMGVPYYIVVEEQEYDNYASVISNDKILILDKKYQQEYDTCDSLGDSKSKGPGPARNFCWEHSLTNGATKHWVMDDNIMAFGRLNYNLLVRVSSGTILKCAEDFVDRYENVAISGFQYDFFRPSKCRQPPYILNTRIYSCLLMNNSIPYRWRGRYNEDTDLSLRVLKDGWCTVQFNVFRQEKAGTQTIKGGNTDEFYAQEGTLNKSKMIEELHHDVAKVVWKFGRWHHQVDYSSFKKNSLTKKEGLVIPDRINNYGMKLVEKENA